MAVWITVNCPRCGRPYQIPFSRAKKNTGRKFCSDKCTMEDRSEKYLKVWKPLDTHSESL